MQEIEKLNSALEYAIKNKPEKNGFPFLAECLHKIGVTKNIWTLPANQSMYLINGKAIINNQTPKETEIEIIPDFDKDSLMLAIKKDKAGEINFPDFLKLAFQAGVFYYEVDFEKRTVSYFGTKDNKYIEEYPKVEIKEIA